MQRLSNEHNTQILHSSHKFQSLLFKNKKGSTMLIFVGFYAETNEKQVIMIQNEIKQSVQLHIS